MRKLMIILGLLFLLLVGGFALLLSMAGPDNAPSEEVIVDLETPRG